MDRPLIYEIHAPFFNSFAILAICGSSFATILGVKADPITPRNVLCYGGSDWSRPRRSEVEKVLLAEEKLQNLLR